MPKKDTKLQKLSESIQYTIDEMRGLGIEGLDQLFLEIYMEEAEQLTDSRQQAKVKHSMKDVIGIVFFAVLAGNDEWTVSCPIFTSSADILPTQPARHHA